MKDILMKYMSQFTTLTVEQQQAVLDELQIEDYPKGTVLLRQGEFSTKCYFVLKGCIRQYAVDEDGRETTSNFYTEEQAVSCFNRLRPGQASAYSFVCTEDSILVVGEMDTEKDMYRKYNELETMTRQMMEVYLAKLQDEFAAFVTSSPEERYKELLHRRPQLINRVPQHQLASYLGMTPESLSRIKKRIQ
jgi:CRP-like cAMP-binding protein